MRDFLEHPGLVLRRYQLTRVEPELRKRELVEHERYVVLTRAYLREHMPEDGAPYLPMALAALIDAMHRSALGNFARSNGQYRRHGRAGGRHGLDPGAAPPAVRRQRARAPPPRRAARLS